MAGIQHANVSVSNIHECKGANTASINTVRISDGAGSGSWTKVSPSSITAVNNINIVTLNYTFTDISTPSSQWIVCPIAGIISKIYTVINGAIITADTTMSFKIAGVAVTNGNIVIPISGSGAGVVGSSTPTAARTLTAGQALEIISDGASSNVINATISFIINVT